jgi:flagellar motor switch/type III secretory pathway protein FliN
VLSAQKTLNDSKTACKEANLDPNDVAKQAGVLLIGLKDTDMAKLRDTFKSMKEQPKPLTNAEAEKAIVETFKATPVEPVHNPNVKPSNPDSKVGGTQLAKLKALMNAKGFDTPEAKLELAVGSVKHPLNDLNEMTKGEVWELIETLDPQ